jgi:hypothetical protein
MKDPFEELGLSAGASPRDIRRAYAAKLKEIDQKTERDAFLRLREVYDEALLLSQYSIVPEERDPAGAIAHREDGADEEVPVPPEPAKTWNPPAPLDVDFPVDPEAGAAPWPRAEASVFEELRQEIERIYAVFTDTPSMGHGHMRLFAERMNRESLDQSEFAQDEWIEKLYATSARWEAGERKAQKTFLSLLESCEKCFTWESLATEGTIRQQQINSMHQIRRRMQAHASNERSRKREESSYPWRYVFFGVMLLSIVAKACPSFKSSNQPKAESIDSVIEDLQSKASPLESFLVYEPGERRVRIPGIITKTPLSNEHRYILSAYAGTAFTPDSQEAIVTVEHGVAVFVDVKGTREKLVGSRTVRLLLHDPVARKYYFLLDPW